MGIKFGTDGWRAIIGEEYTFDNVRKVAQAHADHFKENGFKKVAVGYDTRFLSDEFAEAVAEVFASNGIEVVLSSSICTTPALSVATKELGADEGVMITASHNIYKYNGYKVKLSTGSPATPSVIANIEKNIGGSDVKRGVKNWEEVDFNKLYKDKLKSYLTDNIFRQKNLKVIHDAMFGATMGIFSDILRDTFLEVIEINNYRDLAFGGHHPEPIDKNLDLLKKKVVAEKGDIGIANDGDGDRVGIVNENGEFIGTQLGYVLLLLHTIRNRKEEGAIAKTTSVSYLVDRIAEKENRKLYETPVGFKYIAELFEKDKIAFGGEESGGYGFGFHIPERDGVLAGLMMLEMIILHNKPVSKLIEDIFSEFGTAYYKRVDLRVEGNQGRELVENLKKNPPKELAGFKIKKVNMLDGVKLIFENDGWIMFRASGTEPVLRIYVEMPDKESLEKVLEEGIKLI
ncbi:MAG: phosphoglucomutase/phosphomannomutase family protein [Aquificae bacterium]|nr:phosphoglucomutase/phosphomannomutase family protein [Aquificota bacterium]